LRRRGERVCGFGFAFDQDGGLRAYILGDAGSAMTRPEALVVHIFVLGALALIAVMVL
jgi:hypothetical protein